MSAKLVSGDFVFVSPRKAKSLSANLACPGDLILTQRGTLGQVSVVPGDAFESYLVSQSQMKVSLNRTRHDPHFVHQYFASHAGQKQILNSAIQTGVPHTNLGILRAYRIPSPPLPEQRAIAAALSDVDALLEGLTRLIAKKRDLKQAAMQQLLTRQTRLPGFHDEWEVKRLGEFAEMGSGGTPATSVPANYDGDIPWVSISDMTKGGKVIASTERNLTRAGFVNSAAQMFPIGTVLYAMYASLGECSIAGIPLCSSQAILGIRPQRRLSNEFLYYYLTSLKPIVKSLGQQGTQANLNKGMVQDFRLRLPSLPEQTTIASVLSDMDAELSALEVRCEKTRALKQAMMQELLTGRTRLV
ncbi:MAG TPA: restriction endonuclease subunit S [Thermoanaerobaculia bacterium]|nr:restriction endonuclease subunit S [Thermoanaerobaculia bacterium]